MKSQLWSSLLMALLALPLAAQVGPGRGFRAERISHALNLTEPQKASIRAIREKHRAELTQRRDAVLHARIDLRTALQDPAAPEARLRALFDKASAARFDVILARRSLRAEVQAVLTPDQRAQAAELRHLARTRMQGRMRQHRPESGMAD